MEKSLGEGFVEQIPPNEVNLSDIDLWHLNIFCVEQARKVKCRLAYDASARYGSSLNDALYLGPAQQSTQWSNFAISRETYCLWRRHTFIV